MDQQVFEKFDEGCPEGVEAFSGLTVQTAVINKEMQTYGPSTALTKNSPIHFTIPGTGGAYIDLRETRLCLKCKITRPGGANLEPEDPVSIINAPLHTIFRQVDCSLNQVGISNLVQNNYSIKSYLNLLLPPKGYRTHPALLESALFLKDTAGYLDDTTKGGPNEGLVARAEYFSGSKVCELEGNIYHDFFLTSKFLPFGIQLDLKLYPQSDDFILIQDDDTPYEFHILNAILRVCKVNLNPNIITAHSEVMKKEPMIFPFISSDVKSYSLASSLTRWSIDDITNPYIPHNVYVVLVNQRSYSPGNRRSNPFHFMHAHLSYISFTVDGKNVPLSEPYQCDYSIWQDKIEAETSTPVTPPKETGGTPSADQPNIEGRRSSHSSDRGSRRSRRSGPSSKYNVLEANFLDAYMSLYDTYDSENVNMRTFIRRRDFNRGYAIYRFNITGPGLGNHTNLMRKGHTRLSIGFKKPLNNAVTVVVYSTLTGIVQIDEARNITLRE